MMEDLARNRDGVYEAQTPVVMVFRKGTNHEEVVRVYDKLEVLEENGLTRLVGARRYTEYRQIGRDEAYGVALINITKRALEAEKELEKLQEENEKLQDENEKLQP